MSSQDRFAKLKEQIAKLKQQVPLVAEKIRTAKVALPKVLDPIQKAKEALGGAAGSAAQDLASLQQDVDDISKSFPDINKVVTDASSAMAGGEQAVKDLLKETAPDAQQKLLTKLQSSLPGAALNDAKSKVDQIKARLTKSKETLAKLEQSGAPVSKLKGSVDAIFGQVPGISDLVGQTLQKLPAIQNPVDQVAGLLKAPSGKAAEDIAARLAKVQDHAKAIGDHVSKVSGLMSKGAAAVPAVKQRMDQVQKLLTGAAGPAGPDTLSNLSKLVDEAIGEAGATDDIADAAQKFGDFSKLADEGNQLLESLLGQGLPADLKDKVSQVKGALDQARTQLPNASSLVGDIAKRTGDISSQVKKAKDVLGNVTKTVGGPVVEKVSKL